MWKLTLLSICLLLAIPCQADTITVDANGYADFNTIQAAIDDVNTIDGDEIVVSEGTYYENINTNGKAITIRSTNPLDPNTVLNTVIDANGSGHLVKTNPIRTQFPKSTNECKLIYNKGLQKKRRFRSPKKQTQNKPNFRNAKINENLFATKDYENETAFRLRKYKPNSNPICRPSSVLCRPSSVARFRMKPKLLNFPCKNSLTGLCNSIKYPFLCSERECFYEELYGKEKSGRA